MTGCLASPQGFGLEPFWILGPKELRLVSDRLRGGMELYLYGSFLSGNFESEILVRSVQMAQLGSVLTGR